MSKTTSLQSHSLFEDLLFKRLLMVVVLAHAILFILAWFHPEFSRSKPIPKHVIVKTITLAPPAVTPPLVKPIAAASSPKPATTASQPKPKTAPPKAEQKKAEQKKEVVKETKPLVKENKKESPKPKPLEKAQTQTPAVKPVQTQPKPQPKVAGPDKALLAEAQKALANVTTVAPLNAAALPEATDLKQVPALTLFVLDSQSNDQYVPIAIELGYCDELIARMRLFLRLPTYGDVRVRLSVQRSGSVNKVEILSSSSIENSAYVQKMLPQVQFPSFGQNFSGEEQHSFLVTLTNE